MSLTSFIYLYKFSILQTPIDHSGLLVFSEAYSLDRALYYWGYPLSFGTLVTPSSGSSKSLSSSSPTSIGVSDPPTMDPSPLKEPSPPNRDLLSDWSLTEDSLKVESSCLEMGRREMSAITESSLLSASSWSERFLSPIKMFFMDVMLPFFSFSLAHFENFLA